tara:strand:+ start:199 stop:834 length:636 start_codon:yes stop_codon:yes gene_type:complete
VGTPKIHLASASSRRLEMLKKALLGQCVSISASPLVSPEITPPTGLDVGEQVAAVLANKIQSAKVEFSLQLESENIIPDFIIVADTLVEDPEDFKISLGQPNDRNSGAVMLLRLSGGCHNVWSGTAVLSRDESGWKIISNVEYATVEIDDLSPEIIIELLESNSWVGKAGGYDLAGEMGNYARVISGDENCVLGFSPLIIEHLIKQISQFD